MNTTEQNAAGLLALQATKLLRGEGVFVRETGSRKWPYEVIVPGDWTKFESLGLTNLAFRILMEDDLQPHPLVPRRWIPRK